MVRPKGGRAQPRYHILKSKAEKDYARAMEHSIFNSPEPVIAMTPEMRIGKLMGELEQLEGERERLKAIADRPRVRFTELPRVEDRIKRVKAEIFGIYKGIAEGMVEEPEYEVVFQKRIGG